MRGVKAMEGEGTYLPLNWNEEHYPDHVEWSWDSVTKYTHQSVRYGLTWDRFTHKMWLVRYENAAGTRRCRALVRRRFHTFNDACQYMWLIVSREMAKRPKRPDAVGSFR